MTTLPINLPDDIQPIARIEQLCLQSGYRYKMMWDEFPNGFMITCKLYKKCRNIAKESQWVKTSNIDIAKNTVAALLLHRINLGIDLDNKIEKIIERTFPKTTNITFDTSIKYPNSELDFHI